MDDPDQQVSLTNLASALLDYVGGAARTSVGRSWFEGTEGALRDYIEMVVGWSQMTGDDVSVVLPLLFSAAKYTVYAGGELE